MKASEIKEAALKAQDLCCNGDTCRQCQAEIEKFEAGARWYAEQTKHFMDETGYYDDEEMLEKVYALCQIEEGK